MRDGVASSVLGGFFRENKNIRRAEQKRFSKYIITRMVRGAQRVASDDKPYHVRPQTVSGATR